MEKIQTVIAINDQIEIAFLKVSDRVIGIHGDYEYETQKFDISFEEIVKAMGCLMMKSADNFEEEIVEDDLRIGRKNGKFYYVRSDYEYDWVKEDLSEEEVERFIAVLKMMIA